jgi:BlaI family penicillinase repressor
MESLQLGRVQQLIMQVLWNKRNATAREITETISAAEPIAHSTVQTMLRVLEGKSAVSYELDGRTFIFFPLVDEAKFKQTATQELVERVFGGNVSSLVAHLLNNENVSRKEISEIRKLIDQKKKR